jgi:secondary thiamine-phosphate synthase enzyme
MAVVTRRLRVSTSGENDMVDLTRKTSEAVTESEIRNGLAMLFVPGSTASVTTIEFEPGLLQDFPKMLERIAPKDLRYEHQRAWNDDNGHSHVKAALLGPSLSVPFVQGKLVLGTWQQIVLIELDTRPRDREVVVQLMGE